ncbi:cation-translocating P-type ATPase [Candidatus Saccharibacteria bacterium]|nr:cation-translocating P-type ATPase [Candidatus Saccharibacteria bacterium]
MARIKYYHLNIEDVFSKLDSGPDGISKEEAANRLSNYGKNELESVKPRPKILKFLDQFHDMMVIILIISAIVSGTLAVINHETLVDSCAILLIVVINALLGFFQEQRADNAIDALSKMQGSFSKVRRGGEVVEIPSSDIVPGDVLILEAGDSVPADTRIISQAMLKVNESALTGESEAVDKDTNALRQDIPLSERKNMVFAGTTVVNGRAEVIACETGMNTQVGIIADSLATVKKEITPLEQKINSVGKVLTGIIVVIIVIMLVVGIIRGRSLLENFMLAISLAVAAIPEGLTAVITVIMSIGVGEMAKKRAVIRKMSSIETLGSTDIICSDKTGTITKNQMQIIEIYSDGKIQSAEHLMDNGSPSHLAAVMALANDAEKNHQKYLGDPTEIALYECLERYFSVDGFRDKNPRMGELPFDSERKMMTAVNKIDQRKGDGFLISTKGSLDAVLEKCTMILKNGKQLALTAEEKSAIISEEGKESSKAYRVLAYAYKESKNFPKIDSSLETDLVFLGFSSMRDAPRPDVKRAICTCKTAGIKPVMITGDSLSTATAVARDVGILEQDSEATLGSVLDDKTDTELIKIVQQYTVYARVSPANKMQIVNAWKELGKVVAMTGDGVNDAPALKAADVGIGMGITGTEVAKAEAGVILMNDSFSTIVTAIREGRRVFDNIRGVLVYLLTGNLAEVVVVFTMTMFDGFGIFTPLQLLYINLITDSVPAIMLAFEDESDDIMSRPSRRKNETFFTPFLVSRIAISAILKTTATLLMLFLFGSTAAFFTLVLLEIIYAYTCRNLKQPIWKNKKQNKKLNISSLILVAIQIVVFFTPLSSVFGLDTLEPVTVLASVGVVLLIFILDETSKLLVSKIRDYTRR